VAINARIVLNTAANIAYKNGMNISITPIDAPPDSNPESKPDILGISAINGAMISANNRPAINPRIKLIINVTLIHDHNPIDFNSYRIFPHFQKIL
jgi:hypothetical protein